MLLHCASALLAVKQEQIPHFAEAEAPHGCFFTGPLYMIEKNVKQDFWEEL